MLKKQTIMMIFIFLFILFITGCGKKSINSESKDRHSHYTEAQWDSLTLSSFEKIDNYPLYSMTYYGDYGFAEYLKTGNTGSFSSTTIVGLDEVLWGCTCFAAMGNGDTTLFGRNFDWYNCIPLLLFTDPPDGYASVSMVDLQYFGYDRSNLPDSPANRQRLLNTPWLPFDGMNEMGVTIGIMAIPHAESPYDPNKVTIGEIQVVRLVLDYAENTKNAINLIKKYNVAIEDPPIHYLIADPTGHSAIIEFVNREMIIIENNEPWQVSTNFIIHGSGAPDNVSCWRYNTVYHTLKTAKGIILSETATELLQQVSQSHTIWSIVYEMSSNELHIAVDRKYHELRSFKLEIKG